MIRQMKWKIRFVLVLLVLAIVLRPYPPPVSALSNPTSDLPEAYRAITHLHTSFSHDARFWSEPNLQLKNLKDRGYQVVIVSEHDYSTRGSAQTDFLIPPFKNGGFEKGRPYPDQWKSIRLPRSSAEYLNMTESNVYFEGNSSIHLKLKGNRDDFDLLSWAYLETGEDRTHDRSIAYNLLLKFSLNFPDLMNSSDSLAYISLTLGRRGDPRYHEVSNILSFYFSEESWEDEKFFDLSNNTRQASIRLDPPFKEWKTYTLNITDYALKLFDGLEDVPTKYLFLKQMTVNLISRHAVPADIYADGFQIYSGWTPAEMYDWWRKDIESYSDDVFLVIAGLETTLRPDIGAYGLKIWQNFSNYDLVEERVNEIEKADAISCIANPRASNFSSVREGGGWGAQLLEIYNTVHDSEPSSQVLKAWDEFLSSGVPIFGVVGFDSHGLQTIQGSEQPSVVSEPIYENLIIASSLNRDQILSSLREGLVYVIRSHYHVRMSLSAGLNGPQQGKGVIFTSSETGAVLNVHLENVPVGSQLVIIQNGTRALTTEIQRDPFNWEYHLPMTGEAAYFRIEVHHEDRVIVFSNPLFFKKTSLLQDIWLALDPTLTSSTVTSVKADNARIEVRLESPANDSGILRIHSPSKPDRLIMDGIDYAEYEYPTIRRVTESSRGWNYNSTSKMSILKFNVGGPTTVVIEFSNQMSNDLKPVASPLLEIGAISAGLVLIPIILFRHKLSRNRSRQ